jgi:hypothetical protein
VEDAAAFRERAGVRPTGTEGCDAGYVAACEGLLDAASDRGPLLERLCHLSSDRWCPELAEARIDGAPGVLQPEDPDGAWFVDGGVLFGWLGETFGDHALLPYTALERVEIRQSGDDAVVDDLVLITADGEWVVPVNGCGSVVAAVGSLHASGVDVRSIAAHGGPSRSTCVTDLRDPAYHGGEIRVRPTLPDDVRRATERKAKLDAAAATLFACLEGGSPPDPLVAEIVHRRGPASRVTVTKRSRDAAFDTCATAWLSGADLGEADTRARYTVEIELW